MAAIGILHPGEMGAAVGATLVAAGCDVLWASQGRSPATRRRAQQAGLTDVTTVAQVVARAEMVVSVCPPAAALEMAREVGEAPGLYLDANAISPESAQAVATVIGSGYVDGSVIGPPPRRAGTTRLYLSGTSAARAAAPFAGTTLDARVLHGPGPSAASALKMAYAGWTKGSAALLLAIAQAARELGVIDALTDEWAVSQPELVDRLAAAESAREGKGWRWEGEMREIAATLRAQGLPSGFHEAAAEIYASAPRPDTGWPETRTSLTDRLVQEAGQTG